MRVKEALVVTVGQEEGVPSRWDWRDPCTLTAVSATPPIKKVKVMGPCRLDTQKKIRRKSELMSAAGLASSQPSGKEEGVSVKNHSGTGSFS